MCFSKNTSIASFVIGTLINIGVAAYITQTNYDHLPWRYAILAGWQFAILMQLPEAVGWSFIERNQNGPASVEKAAYWLNTLQPLAAFVFVAGAYLYTNNSLPPIVSSLWLCLAMTLAFTIVAAVKSEKLLGRPTGIAPIRGCDHLDLHWWNELYPYLPIYLIAVFSSLLALPKNSMVVSQSLVFFVTLLLSKLLYNCGIGSLWCWSVVGAGLTVLIR
jgi:hypothetical protein